MSDKFFPGFEGDDEPKKAPAKPAAPASAPAPGGFSAFGEAKIDASIAGAAKAAVPVPVPGAAKPAAPAAPVDPTEADLKPGHAKDLWKCPHCGTGNKPGRTTCRSCGKSPSDPVIRPAVKNPVILAGIGGAVVLVIVLMMLVGGGDVTLSPAGPDALDRSPRQGGAGTEQQFEGQSWLGRKGYAVSGRVVAVRPVSGLGNALNVALALGPDAANEEAFATVKWAIEGQLIEERANPRGVTVVALHLVFNGAVPAIPVGHFLSLKGEKGQLSEGTSLVSALNDSFDTVLVTEHQAVAP